MERNSANWRTNPYSDPNGGQCVEIGNAMTAVVVQDTTDRAGATLTLPSAWRTLLAKLCASHA